MPLDLSRIRALCFDLDGTLSDTDDHMAYHLARRLAFVRWMLPDRNPYPLARACIMALESPGNFVYGLFDWLGVDYHLDHLKMGLANQLSRHGWRLPPPAFWIMPQVREMLEHLGTLYPMSIVSARDAHGTHAFLKQFQLGAFFRAVAHAQTCRHTKPFPDPIHWAACEMGIPSEHCLMIGDTPVDIRAGKAAGAQTVGVLCGFGYEKELRRAGADLIITTTSDLLEILIGQSPLCQTLPALNA